MFICEKCLEDKYENFAIAFSYGKCEECNKLKACSDIPSSRLVVKALIHKVKED